MALSKSGPKSGSFGEFRTSNGELHFRLQRIVVVIQGKFAMLSKIDFLSADCFNDDTLILLSRVSPFTVSDTVKGLSSITAFAAV